MPDILVRDVDPLVIEKLKKRAALLGTSLQAEAKRAIEGSVRYTREEFLERMQELQERTKGRSAVDTVELIHEMREERTQHLLDVTGRPEETAGDDKCDQ